MPGGTLVHPVAMLDPILAMLISGVAVPPPNEGAAAKPPRAGIPPRRDADNDGDDDDETKAQPKTTVVITGRKLDVARTQINAELGATVYSLGNDAIDDRPGGETSSMAVMLAQTPGVALSGDALTIRGSKDVQVRINNVIIPEAVADPAEHLSIRLAQTTTVMTGTLPAQYGFVPAGVINIITKSGLYRHGGELEFYAGSNSFTEPAFEWAGSVLGNSLFASGSRETGRMDVADLSRKQAGDRTREAEGLAFVDRILGPNDRLSLIIGGSNEHHSIGATSLPAGTEDNSDDYAVGSFQHSVDGITVQTSLFFGHGSGEMDYAEPSRVRRSSVGTQIDLSYDPGATNVLRAGVLASRAIASEQGSDAIRTQAHRTSVGVYLQDEWKLSPQLTFNPGIRLDWLKDRSGGQIEPRASLVWTSSAGLTAHLGYARYAAIVPLDDANGASALPTEFDDYWDAGLQYRLGALTLGADAYARSVRNFLAERQTIGSSLTESFAFRRARFRGIELSATYASRPLSAWVNMSLSRAQGRGLIDPSATFAATIIAAADNWIALSSQRPVSGSAGVTWRSGKFAFAGTLTASSGPVISPDSADPNGSRNHAYETFGVAAIYHAGLGGRLSDFRIDINNLANAHYRLNDASNLEGGWTHWAEGRAIILGVEQGF